MNPELIKALAKAGGVVVVSSLFAWYMHLNHVEKMAAMEDKDDVLRKLMQRQTESLERIAETYAPES